MKPLVCVVLCAGAIGCAGIADPCAAEKGLCVTVQIDSSATVTQIDSAVIHAVAPGIDHSYATTATHAGRVNLPVAVAVVFGGVADGSAVTVGVTGMLGGRAVGAGQARATLSASRHPIVHVTLDGIAPSAADMSVARGDMAGGTGGSVDMALTGLDIGFETTDLAGSKIGVDNGTHEFDPTAVGNASAAFAFSVGNTGHAPTPPLQRNTSGDTGEFVISGDTCAAQVLASVPCSLSVSFKPTSYGTKRMNITYDGGADGLVVIQVAGVATDSEALTVTIAGSGSGGVSGAGLTCGGNTCSGSYAVGATVPTVTLTATASNWSDFAGWSGGGCSGTGTTCMVTMDAAKHVTATFNQRVLVPSHVDASFYKPSAADLSGVTTIDTTNLTINGATQPSSVFTHDQHGWAVLSVGGWTVDQNISVTGNAPLVVVAARAVYIHAIVFANASGSTPGPGGGSPTSPGSGAGGQGPDQSSGGGNFGGGASAGGSSTFGPGLSAGATYGSQMSDFNAGSAGGNGGPPGAQAQCGSASIGRGGAGGGAVQISSAVSITIDSGAKGIDVSGGGGGAGCDYNDGTTYAVAAAGGGGSGGEVFLEAPTIAVGGILAANGGGGGATNSSLTQGAGGNGTFGSSAANGNAGEAPTNQGGNGAYGTTPASPASGTGAGGGGVGRIWLRTHSSAATVTGTISPPPTTNTML